ncbi:5-formyltetrahydrofolate cyclo-ligase [Phocaeicola sp.]|uniref:5-formyltetrahydrofolate cyclo-ligase n=1 Tax=Phocaeicola sp. TaxID=2773926 RepID=UPI002607C09A|nr:5-formyltetrahydrofolate cyclo-ligase [Phocaeicola sp.]
MTKSAALLEKLEQHPRFIAARTVLLYYSLSDEVQTHDFVEKWHRQKRILLPVVKGDSNMLELRIYTGKNCLKTSKAYHIEEPEGETFTAYKDIELAVIPGVSFDAQGNRLGRGKGYYDRLLPSLVSYNIGICFGFQVSEKIPAESFDRVMDEVWTEDGNILCKA